MTECNQNRSNQIGFVTVQFSTQIIPVRKGQLTPSQLGHSSPCRDVTYHPTYHALCAIAYQLDAMIQIWRHDFTLAKAAQRPRVQVKPTEDKNNRERNQG